MRGVSVVALPILALAACGGSTSTTTTEAPAPRGPTAAAIIAGGSPDPDLDLRRRLHAGTPDRDSREREGQRLYRERAAAAGAPAGRRYRQLSPAGAPHELRRGFGARRPFEPAPASLPCGTTTTPTRHSSRCRRVRSTAPKSCTSARRRTRPRCLRGRRSRGRSWSSTAAGAAPRWTCRTSAPTGKLGSHCRDCGHGGGHAHRHLRAGVPDTAHRGEAEPAGASGRDPAAAHHPAHARACRSCSASRSTSSSRGIPGRAIQGEVTFEGSDVGATNVVAILEGADPALRGRVRRARRAQRRHRHRAAGGPRLDPGLQHGHATPRRQRSAGRAECGAGGADQGRWWTACGSSSPARLDSIVNGADDDGSGSMALLEIAEAVVRGAARDRSGRCSSSGIPARNRGSRGSRWFTDNPTVPRDSIVAQINSDMIARGGPDDEARRDPAYLQVIGSRRLSTELGDLAEAVNRDGGFNLSFDYSYDANGHPDNFYCRGGSLHVRPVRDPDRLLQHRRAPGLPPGDG